MLSSLQVGIYNNNPDGALSLCIHTSRYNAHARESSLWHFKGYLTLYNIIILISDVKDGSISNIKQSVPLVVMPQKNN